MKMTKVFRRSTHSYDCCFQKRFFLDTLYIASVLVAVAAKIFIFLVVFQVCDTSVVDLFSLQIFNYLLLVLCIVYAYMTRHVPRSKTILSVDQGSITFPTTSPFPHSSINYIYPHYYILLNNLNIIVKMILLIFPSPSHNLILFPNILEWEE